MRIAICFYGLHPDITNTKYINKNLVKNFVPQYLEKNFMNQYENIDSFVHSWSIEKKEKIIKEYNPTEYDIEEQKIFNIPEDIKNTKNKNNNTNNEKCKQVYKMCWVEVMFSMFYSIKKVLNLMNQYEKNNKIEYDIVILSLMDIIWLKPFTINKIDDRTAIYNPIWGKKNYHSIKNNYKMVKGDLIIGNSNNIYKLNTIYDDLPKYIRKYKEESSAHIFFKDKQREITKNIKFKFNDSYNNPVEVERQRSLVVKKILPENKNKKLNYKLLILKRAMKN
jgi:hypothetical protein